LENVRGENVSGINNWHRGEEKLLLTTPRIAELGVLGLGREREREKEKERERERERKKERE